MEKEQFLKIFELYKLTAKLKNTLRQGWVKWCVEGERVESVAEHVFGTCMLAMSIYAETKPKVDIDKVILMLVLHETEEILIGDITIEEVGKLKTKKEDGRKAVLDIFKDFGNAEHFLSFIEEFEAKETPEAIFANHCDKFEADLQAFHYEGKFNIDKVDKKILELPQLQELKNNGYSKVSQFFLQNDKCRFSGDFLEMANFLEEMEK